MKRSKLIVALAFALVAGCFSTHMSAKEPAQNESQPDQSAQSNVAGANSRQRQTADNNAEKPVGVYRVEFTLTEFEDNKKTNSRSYSLLAQTHTWNKLRIGTRLPMATAASATMEPVQFQYIDVGMNIDCNIEERDGFVLLNTTVDVSGMASQREEQTHQPIIRQMKAELRTVLIPGKPTVVSTDDDPTGKGRFQLEATATKVK